MADTKTLEATAVELMNQLIAGIKAIAGPAMDLALATVRLSSIGDLVVGAISIAIAMLGVKYTKKLFIQHNEEYAKMEYEAPESTIAMLIFCCILSFLFSFAGLLMLLDKWNWIGAFAPEVRLANEVIEKIL